ncbi:MAG: hypothetical protein D6722_18120 [Bacteroidetes bacterium]|nr:MAG: hypothetical protein D6722_18120 [Bacteroidota bacterium]
MTVFIRILVLGLFFLGSTSLAQPTSPQLRKLKNPKHQQHAQRVKALVSAETEAKEIETALHPDKSVYILRVRRNKNRQDHRNFTPAEPDGPEDLKEFYYQSRQQARRLKYPK